MLLRGVISRVSIESPGKTALQETSGKGEIRGEEGSLVLHPKGQPAARILNLIFKDIH